MGTPEFAVPSLRALLDNGYEVVCVVTQPDRPVGRSKMPVAPPVKQIAQEAGVPVLQFEKVRTREGREAVESFGADLYVTCAFGQILSQRMLDFPRLGTINVHASLLPQYRGPAPINWCIVNGETVTGVTTMYTDAGIDTGAMLLRESVEIGEDEDAQALSERLSHVGARVLMETLRALKAGELTSTPQQEEKSSRHPMLRKELGRMDFSRSARELHNQIRGLYPWPGAYAHVDGQMMKVWKARVEENGGICGAPGQVLTADAKAGLVLACGQGSLRILELQAPGGKRMSANDYLRGKPMQVGAMWENQDAE